MAELHPDLSHALTLGQRREHDMLRYLADTLPAAFRIYHGLHWSTMHEGTQRHGELDAVVLAPSGHLVVLEVKAGEVDLSDAGLFKQYGVTRKNIAHQAHAQLHGLIGRLRAEGLDAVRVNHFLLLPDFRVANGAIGYPRERIIDASQLEALPQLLVDATLLPSLAHAQRERLVAFLTNRFEVVPDAACRLGQRRTLTQRLAAGLATWVPRIASPAGVYVVEATAGSGKTQLALQLLHAAAAAQQRARYVCFNRPLADHIGRLAPPRAEVGTVHEFAIHALRSTGVAPDFSQEGTFRTGIEALSAASARATPALDLLVIDESQDFESDWLEALLPWLRPDGRLYVLGDADQAIYRKEPFELPDATRIVCHNNFRSPRRLVQAINAFGLTEAEIKPQGPEAGEPPGLHVHDGSDPGGLQCVRALVNDVLRSGHRAEDVALLSFRGRERSRLLAADALGPLTLKKFTGGFDSAGNPVWTEGDLLAESVYRFKGQSAPVVIVCEIDFEVLDRTTRSKLFVAMTRAQTQLHLVMSAAAERALAERLGGHAAA